MPKSQVASVANFDFGAPAVAAEVLRFKVKQGGKLAIKVENPEGVADAVVSLLVSEDGSSFAALVANENGEVVTDEAVVRRESREFNIYLRQGVDNYLQVTASGSTRVQFQIRGDAIMDATTF